MADAALRLFVAMPGTDMGPSADWKHPNDIKNHFYEPIRKTLSERLGREVTLVIEKDKVLAGPIHASMFKEALTADIYIADLTGNNANVYLELGARWTSRDAVTVVVSQTVSDILFNAARAARFRTPKIQEVWPKRLKRSCVRLWMSCANLAIATALSAKRANW